MSVSINNNNVAATATITKKAATRKPAPSSLDKLKDEIKVLEAANKEMSKALDNSVVIYKGGMNVYGRGTQVVGNNVLNSKTAKDWKRNFAVLSAVLQSAEGLSNGQRQEALIAAGLTATDVQFYLTGAKVALKPDLSKFAKKA